MLHREDIAHVKGNTSKGKGSFYTVLYPVCWAAQSAFHFLPPPPAYLFILTPTRLLREAF